MVKIYLDPGHGGTDPGAQGNGLQEKNVTLAIALKVRDILNRDYEGHTIRMSRSSDATYRSILMLVVVQDMRTIFIMVVSLVRTYHTGISYMQKL